MDTPSIPSMSHTERTLNELKAGLKDHADLLEAVPSEKVIMHPQTNESDAISFAIEISVVSDQDTQEKRAVWAYLFPAAKPGESVQIKFHSPATAFSMDVWYAAADVIKFASERSAAFEHTTSGGQLTALCKFYFLKKIVEQQFHADDKLMEFGTAINKTFLGDLQVACRRYVKSEATKVAPKTEGDVMSEATMSDESDVPSRRVILAEFESLRKEEAAVVSLIRQIDHDITAKNAQRKKYEDLLADIAKRRKNLLEPLSKMDVFELATDLAQGVKRQRTK